MNPPISTEELKNKLENLKQDELVIDVRTPGEYAEMHIDDDQIQNIELNQLLRSSSDFKDKKLYLICNSGNRSGMAQMVLQSQGLNAVNVAGGLLGWMQKDLPLKSEYN